MTQQIRMHRTTTQSDKQTIVIALAGQPNVGKSTIFNMITGLNQHVGNWPGKTVERKTGKYEYQGNHFTFVDLPGTYSLSAQSVEERIAREYIITESPDVVVAVVDAAILERSLYLLAELILLPAPVVMALNMIDVAEQEGIKIEPNVLQAALGVPVVPMCATRNEGITEMLDAVLALHRGEFQYNPRSPTILEDHKAVLSELITLVAGSVPAPYPVDWIALKLLEGDEAIIALVKENVLPEVWSDIHHLLFSHEDAILDIAGARYAWISRMVRAAVERPKVGQMGLTARLDAVLTAPFWGTISLLGILAIVFWLTYAIGTPLQEWLNGELTFLADYVAIVLAPLMPSWFVNFISAGLLGGAGMVLTFMPILLIFFTTLGILEDTGYMARAAYITDRYMHVMGLHGKSFIPLLLGFGCNVPAVLGSRIIESKRARTMTILLAPLVPCTAQMAVIAILASTLFESIAGIVAWSLVAMNLVLLALLGIIFRKTIFRGEQAAFIMELPLYHMPNWRTIGLYVWHNILAFFQKAGTVILGASVVVWALSYFPGGGNIEASYLATFGKILTPVGDLMGLPWQVMVSLITSFVAKENTIATLGVLYGDLQTVLPQVLSTPAALGLLVVEMLFIPCVATVVAIKQELQSWFKTALIVGLYLILSLVAGVTVYQVGSWILGG